jgi:hypothetical protein
MASRVLDQYRKQNPQIADKADHEIARDLYSDHYADMDFTEFADRVELEPLDRVRAVDPEKANKPDDQLATEVYQESYSDMDFRDFLGRVGMSPDSYPGLPSESTAGLPPSSTGPGPATGDSVRSQPVGSEQPTDLMGAGSGIIDGVIDSAVDALPSGDYEGADRREARGDTQAETLTTPQSGSGRRGRRADTDAPTLDEPTESRRERRVVRNRPDPNQVGRNFSPGRQDALDAPEPLLGEASSPFTGSSFEQTQGIRDAALSTYLMEDGLSRAGDDLGRGFNRAQTAVKAFDLVDAVSTLESAQERTRERAQQAEFNRMRLTGDSTDQGPDSPEAVARRIESAARRDQDIMARYGDRVESIVSDIEQLQREREELGENVALQQALESGDADQFLSALDANPGAVMSGLLLESTAAMAPVIGAGVVGGFAGGPAGVAAGTGAASAAVESLFTLQEKLQEYGADLSDPESVNEVWQERGGEIVQDAAVRGAAIGLFDAAAGGIGSKAMLPAIRQGASRSARAARAAADVSGRVTTQGALGGGGEAAAQLATEGRISRPADVLAEAVAEFGFAPIEVASTSAAAARRRIQGPQDREAIRRRMLDQGFVEADDGTLQTENVTVELGDNAATATVTTPSPQVRTARRDEDEPQDQPTVAPRGEAGPVPGSERSGTESPANELDSLVDTFASPGTLQRQIDITRDQERQLTEQLRQSGLPDEEIEADGAIQNLRRTAEQLESTQRQIDSRAAEQQANTAIDEGRQPTNDALGQQVEQTRGEAAARSPLNDEIQALRQRFSRPAPLTDQAPDLGAQERSALQRETDILRGRPSADRPVNNPETGEFTSERVATENIQIDPETYQFRDDVNRDGVDDRLSGITRFDDLRAGTVILHERNDGQIFVADGHHRVDLARQLGRDSINAVVLRESDGVSASDARQYAAERNVVEGNATPLDAAKVFRERGGDPATVIEDRDLPRRSQVVRDGAAIAQLSEDAFGAVLNEQITEKDAAAIGRNFTDPDQQLAAVQQYQRVRPANDRQREILADEIRAAGFSQGEQGGLFGEDPAESLITERVRVKDALTRRLSRNRSLFRTLNENAGTAERAGNQIARDRNDAIQQDAAMAADLVRQADTTPSLNQAINEAAQRVKDGESMNRVTAELETRVINEAQQLRAQPQGAPTDNRAGSTDQAGQDAGASQSVRSGDAGRDPAGGESGLPGAESELLTQPTPEDLQARDQAEADRQAAQREAERRADADDQRDNFTLTGSDTEADQAAARGQDALFEGSPAAYTGAGANRIITGQTNTVARESGNEQQIQGDLFTLAGADSVSPRSPDSAFNLDGATEVLSTPTGRFGTVTSTRRTVTYSLPDKPINTAADAATATAQVRKNAQENLLALVTDADGNVLDIIRHSVGDVDSAAANTSLIAGSVLRVPDAANVWVSHNHPGGVSTLSNADKRVFAGLSDLMSGSGVTPQGVLAIGNGRYSAELADGQNVDESTIPPARRTREVAASERTLTRRENLGEAISSPDSARASVRNLGGSEPGVALLNNRNKPVAWIPLSIQEMSRMRSGGVLSRVLQSIERSNANTAILSVGESSLSRSDAQKAIGNMSSFFTAANVRMLDAVSTFSVETLAGNPVVANDVDSQTPDTFFSLGTPAEGPETPATPLGGATEVIVDGTTRPALNSEGRPIHSTTEGVRNFWRWFGDSQVTDGQGRPLVVYHGTAQDFDALSDEARGSSTNAPDAYNGFFFTSEPVVADSFASLAQRRTGEGQGANVIPAYLRIADPLVERRVETPDEDSISDAVEQGRDGAIFYSVNDSARKSPVAIDGAELDGVDPEGQFVADSLPVWEEGGEITRQEIQDELDAAVEFKADELNSIRDDLANETSDSEARLLRNEIAQVEQELQVFTDLANAWRDDPSRVTLVNDTSDVFVAFEAGQVKSAAGNAGSFDGSQDSLRLATGTGQGVNTTEAAQRAANLMGDWKIAPAVKVAATESELPPAVRRKIDARRAQGRVRGVFHKGEVFVVAENVNSLQEMEETILHEVLGHFGIRNVLGANMNKVLDDAYLTIGRSGLQGIANRYKLDLDKRAGRREAVEEYLANMAQTNPDAQIIDRMIRMIREWARSMGFSLSMSNAEVRELINRARRFTRDGEIVSGLTIKESISGGVAMSQDAANAFGEAQRFSLDGAGRINYRPLPAEEGATADDLTQSFPDAIYDDGAADIYGGGTDREQAVLDTLRSVRGQPDATVTIYRANPEGVEGIEPGDFVTLSREYAEDAAEGMSGRVTEMQVPASTVTVSADDLLEQGYYPDGNAEADDSRFMFAGANAEGSDTLSLRKALLMRDGKMPNYVVIRETGWFQGPDGKMRYEIDDSQAELDMESIRGSIRTGEQITLQDAIVHPSLFAAYPGLARLQVFVDDTGKYGGLYNPRGDFIQMNQRLLQAPDQFRSTLLHEIQHAVQNREDFSPGGLASDAMRARVGRAAGDLRDVAADRVLAFEYHNPGIDDREALASFQASMALRYQSAQRLKEYGQKEKPSGVMRLIRKEMQWLYEPDLDQSGSEARRLQADFYNIPKRGAGRNRELGEFAFEAGRVIEGSIPDELLAQFRNDSRKMESMVKALSREAQRAREPVSQRDALKREAEKARKARENIARLDPYGVYRRLAGEVESRNVQTRRDMSADERSQRPPARTVDVDEDEIIVITGGLQMQLPESMASDDGARFSQRPDQGPTSSKQANEAANESGMPTHNGNKAAFETTAYVGRDETGAWVPVTTSDPSIREQNKLKYWAKRYFTKEGQLTQTAYRRHTQMLGMNNADSIAIQGLSADFIQSIDRGYGKSYKRLTADEKRLLNDYLTGSAVEGIPQAVRDELDVMRGMLDNTSNRMQMMILDEVRYALQDMDTASAAQVASLIRRAKEGDEVAIDEMKGVGSRGNLIAKKMRTFLTVEENKGSYLNRSYQVFDDPEWQNQVPDDVVRRARNFLREQVRGDPAFQNLDSKGVEDRVEGVINAILRTDQSGMTGFLGSSQLGEKDLSILKQRKEIAEPIRELMGEYTDPQVNFTRSMSGMSKMVANHHFLRNVREEGLGVFLSAEKSGRFSAEIASYDEERMLPLAGIYATPEFAQAMQDFDASESLNEFWRSVLAVNSSIKYGKTVLSPTTMFRNFYSATMFTVMNGHFDSRKTLDAARATFADVTGSTKKQRDYLVKMARLGVIHDTARGGEIQAAIEDVVSMDTTAGSAPVRGIKKVLDVATSLYQAGDDFWKIVGFENEKQSLIKSGMSESDAESFAATRVRDGYPTYSMVPKGIQMLRRFPFVGTFVSFPWEIMRTSFNQIRMTREDIESGRKASAARRMLGMAIAGSAAVGIKNATMAIFGIDDEDDEAMRELAAPWQMNSHFAYLGTNEDGQMQYLDLSHLDPYTHMKRPLTALMNGNYDSLGERMSAAAKEFLLPFLGADIGAKALGEWALNSKMGSNQQVYDPNAEPLEQGRQVFEHLRSALQPGVLSNMERTLKAFNKQMTSYGKQYDLGDEAMAWVGFRLTTSDPKVSLQFKAFDFQDQYMSAGKPTYEVLRDPNEIDPDQMDGAVDRTYRRWRDAFSEMHSVVRAGRVTGMSDQELAEALDKGGVPKKYIGPLIEEQVPPWSPSDQSLRNAVESVLQYNDTPAMRENLKDRFTAMRRAVVRKQRALMQERQAE